MSMHNTNAAVRVTLVTACTLVLGQLQHDGVKHTVQRGLSL